MAERARSDDGDHALHVITFLLLMDVVMAHARGRPNPPSWPPGVHVFGPENNKSHIESVVNKAFATNGGQTPTNHGEFSSDRFAFLFKPGKYDVEVPVGYYTQVLGIGGQPDDVIFDSEKGIYCEEGNKANLYGALSTFWRGAENFRTRGDMLWSTSQATPLRRIIIEGDLLLAEYKRGVGMGYSSGGFVGNVRVVGKMRAASQQQYCARNANLGQGSTGGVWNMVFIGTEGAPEGHCGFTKGNAATVTVDMTPVIAEKPFISIDELGKYHLHIPLAKRNRVGTDFGWGLVVGFEQVYVAKAEDTAAAINQWLRDGFHVVFTPGIYHLESSIEVMKDNQVLLGLGFATLVAPQGAPAVRVGNVDGVRISGILLEAGLGTTDSLLEWGDGFHQGNDMNPSFLHDVFARVGGTNDPDKAQVGVHVMVRIASGHVVGDNMWLWRADHGFSGQVKHGQNPCDTGLVVTGNNVIMYGLSVEHTLKDLVQWSGENGETYFYQSELPYDVTQEYGDAGYVGYRVNETVRRHFAVGVGVYHFFRDHDVTVRRGIAVPAWLANSFKSPLSVYLSGRGRMLHVLNDEGGQTDRDSTQAQWWCEKGPEVPYVPPVTSTSTATITTSTSRTSTETRTTTPTTTDTWTSTTSTTSSTSVTTTATFTSTKTTTTTTTTSTTTTDAFLWWAVLNPSHGNIGFIPWLVCAVALQSCLVCVLGVYMCCLRRSRADDSNVPVPMSRLIRLLSRQRHLNRSRGHADSQPMALLSPPRGAAARSLSIPLASLSPGPKETQRLQLSPKALGTPGRRGTARMLSMSSIAESGFSLSPGGPAMLSPWNSNASLGWPHGEARDSEAAVPC